MNPDAADFMREAEECLRAAIALRDTGFSGYAAGRAYYAMLNATRALLHVHGHISRSHGEAAGVLGREFVKTGKFPPHLHKALIVGTRVRHRADYLAGDKVAIEEAELQIQRAVEFVNEVRQIM
jgi:uncharacterized protein (UPF0332 family)